MNNYYRKGSVEWRIIWIILVIITALAAIGLIVVLFYACADCVGFTTMFEKPKKDATLVKGAKKLLTIL